MPRSAEITHKIMSAIKSKDTTPEILLRKTLWRHGFIYRKNYPLPGKPDIVFVKYKIAIFCDGDFWHGHNWRLRGLQNIDEEFKSYSQYWKNKITTNIARDNSVNKQLRRRGWKVIRFWGSLISDDPDGCALKVMEEIRKAKK